MKKFVKNAFVKLFVPCYNLIYRRTNRQKHITFISQNCVGGVLYHMLGIAFSSPTINMFIENEHFVKLAENPEHYFSMDAKPYEEHHVDSVEGSDDVLTYPIIRVDDILLCCQHYNSCSEAVEAWNKRRLRVNLKNMYAICCSWNLGEREDLVKRISNLPYPSIVFTTEDFKYPNCVKLTKAIYVKDVRGAVKPNLTSFKGIFGKRYFVDEFDFVKWINR